MAQPDPIPIFEEQETFYTPYFEIKVNGFPLPRGVVRDVISVTYDDSVDRIDSFTIEINNWDADRVRTKYLGVEPGPGSPGESSLFDPGHELELYMGYQGHPKANLRLMMTGFITTLEPSFPQSSSPTLTLRGLNIMDRFRRKQFTWAWFGNDARDSRIAKELSRQPDRPVGRPGLGIEVRIDDKAAADETPEDYIFMNNQYPIVFLMERARRRGYSIYVGEERTNGSTRRFLNFGPSQQFLRDVTYELEWGKSLIQATPTLTTTNQISKVTVYGWNRRTNSQIQESVTIDDRRFARLNPDLRAVAREVGREEEVVNRPVFTEPQARALAFDILQKQLKEAVRIGAATVGLPDLRAGRTVLLKNLGRRFNGHYFVTSTQHRIDDGGYRTDFTARREETESGGAAA